VLIYLLAENVRLEMNTLQTWGTYFWSATLSANSAGAQYMSVHDISVTKFGWNSCKLVLWLPGRVLQQSLASCYAIAPTIVSLRAVSHQCCRINVQSINFSQSISHTFDTVLNPKVGMTSLWISSRTFRFLKQLVVFSFESTPLMR
jgi:hypothetical protein